MRRLLLLVFISTLVITGCSENESTNEEALEQVEKEINEEIEEPIQEETEKEIEEELVEAQYYIAEDSSVLPLYDNVDDRVVLITIDDAPSTYSLEMAETLKQLDVGAIFFVNGHFLDTPEEEEALRQLYEMGFIIGNHTYNHPLLTETSEEKQREEIISLSDRVEEILGERPKFFRAPNGMNTEFSRRLVEDEGMVLMNWTYGYDYFSPYMNADKLAEAMISGEGPEVDVPYSLLKPGANLLMHDREWTNEALEKIITGLQEKGYKIVNPHLIQVLEN